MKTSSLPHRPCSGHLRPVVLALSFVAANVLMRAEDVTLARVQLAQKQYELSARQDGVRRLETPAAAEILWEAADVSEKRSGDSLILTLPVGPNERLRIDSQPAPNGGLVVTVVRTTAANPPPPLATPPPPAAPAAPPANEPAPAVTPPAQPKKSAKVDAAAPVKGAPANSAAKGATSPEPNAPDLSQIAKELGLSDKDTALLNLTQIKLADEVNFDPANKADFAIPEAPAAAVLSQDSALLRPVTPRQTLTSVLGNFEDGKLKSGFALGFVPYTQFRARPVSLREYNTDRMSRFMTNLQVSLAAKTGADATATAPASPSTFGLGVSGVFFDHSDLRLDPQLREDLNDLVAPIADALSKLHEKIAKNEITEIPDVGDLNKAYFDKYNAIKKAALKAHWNAAAMGFGYATRFKSVSGRLDDAKEDGGSAWLNLALPGVGIFAENSQFLFSANYRYHDAFTRNSVTGVEDSTNLGAQWRVGSSALNGYAQGFYHFRTPKGMAKISDTTWELGVEKRLTEGLWLNLGYSSDNHLTGGKQLKTGLRYGFGKAAAISPSP